MNDVAIRVEQLSKQFRIGAAKRRHDTLRDQLMDGLKSLLPWAGPRSLFSVQRGTPTDSIWALKDLSFEVKQGEVLGLIGSNGAGKSTLLKVLSRITEPTAGRAEIYGRVGSLLEVGTGFDRELTGRENVYLSGAILGMRRAEIDRKFEEIVAFSEVEKFIDTPVKRYSSGMYVRLAFAVAAHLDPEILLVDEVLAVGDAAFQKKCLGRMDAVTKGGRTVLFVSHNMAMIENLCPRALLLHNGAIASVGPTKQVIQAYLSTLSDLARDPIATRTDRQGAGEIRTVGLELLDADGRESASPVSGQRAIFRLHFRADSHKIFKNCRVSLSVHKDEICYFLLSTELVDNTPVDLRGTGFIDFAVPNLPLSASTYHLNTFIESNRVVQDWVMRASSFSVIDGDFYGAGRNYPSGWQGRCVLVPFSWELGNHASAPVSPQESSASEQGSATPSIV